MEEGLLRPGGWDEELGSGESAGKEDGKWTNSSMQEREEQNVPNSSLVFETGYVDTLLRELGESTLR